MDKVSIKSCDDSTTLSFRLLGRTIDAIEFVVSVAEAPFVGEVQSTTYFSGPPSLLFRDMAESWKGWKGEKVWSALDGELSLSATTSSLGHVTLKIEMVDPSDNLGFMPYLVWKAGQLVEIYKNVSAVFPLNNR